MNTLRNTYGPIDLESQAGVAVSHTVTVQNVDWSDTYSIVLSDWSFEAVDHDLTVTAVVSGDDTVFTVSGTAPEAGIYRWVWLSSHNIVRVEGWITTW